MKYLPLLLFPLLCACGGATKNTTPAPAETKAEPVITVAFNADSAYQFIVDQCNFGARIPNSAAHKACGDYLVKKFADYGLQIVEQKADLKAWDGTVLKARNIIASHNPEATKRVLVCAHWDCRPWADNDPDGSNHRTPVMGANDGASGVAVMLELARQCRAINSSVGIDFICFDMEDYGVPYWDQQRAPSDGSDWCLGSRHWAQHPHVENYKAEFGVLLDMVGGKDAQFCYEGYSLRYARPIVARVWGTAARLGYKNYFVQKDGSWATDDHVPVNELRAIPCIDIIPYVEGNNNSNFGATWHTVNDTPENISMDALKAVGQTMVEVLAGVSK